MAVSNLQQFLDTLNAAVSHAIEQREVVNHVAQHPTWINNTGRTEIKADFAAMVSEVKVQLDDCNAWLQTL